MKGKILKEKGITLIALVITIIVLLILAGVTINILVNTGIIDNSQNAVDQYAYQAQNETEQIDEIDRILSNYLYKKDEKPGDLGEDTSEGTEKDPYVISSIEDLVAFSYNVNSGTNVYEGKTVTLGRSLYFDGSNNSYADENAKYKLDENGYGYIPDSSSTTTIKELMTNEEGRGFIPIGTNDSNFQGTFDGKNNYLSNIYINNIENTTLHTGLFSVIDSTENNIIKNLGIENSNIKGSYYVGSIVGYVNKNCKIINCYNNKSNITNINGSEDSGNIGGIVGMTNSEIINCYNTGDIINEGPNSTGGVVGNCYYSKIINCYNKGNINNSSTSSNSTTGGIVAIASDIENCYNFGMVQGATVVGGIAQVAFDRINNCYNVNTITNTGSGPVGGITGLINRNPIYTNCYNTGRIIGQNSSNTGEIVGFGTANDTCWYLIKTTETDGYENANTNGAVGKDKATMDEKVSVENYVKTLNEKVKEINAESAENEKLREWKIEGGYPVFK